MIGDKTPRFSGPFLGETNRLPVGVIGDFGEKHIDALATISATCAADAAFWALILVICSFWALVFFLLYFVCDFGFVIFDVDG